MATRTVPPCLEGELQSFLDIANAVMVLDSGVEWHVHSDILALQSSVLSDAYAAHRQSASANEPCRLTLESCSEAEASKFLDFFYYRDTAVSKEHAEKVIELAHFYAVDSALQDYEEFIMQELHEPWAASADIPLHWLVVAHNFHLGSLAASCEELLVPHVEFLCDAPETLNLPIASVLRIMKRSLPAARARKVRRVTREPQPAPVLPAPLEDIVPLAAPQQQQQIGAPHQQQQQQPQQQPQQQQAIVQYAPQQQAPAPWGPSHSYAYYAHMQHAAASWPQPGAWAAQHTVHYAPPQQ